MVTLEMLRKRSTKAVCGVMEREVVVPSTKKAQAIRLIKDSGSFMFIGSGPAGMGRTKIWFIRRGGF